MGFFRNPVLDGMDGILYDRIKWIRRRESRTTMEKVKKATILNICLFVLEVAAIVWMTSGITINGSAGVFSAARWRMLKYFTVDSNILMGVAACMAFLDQRKVLKREKEDVSAGVLIFKLAATAGVTLTLLVTVFFLAPTADYNPLWLFANSNLLLHLINPVLSIIIFVVFEKSNRIGFRHTFTAMIPMLVYAVYYVEEALRHTADGVIAQGYDWYGFFFLGTKSVAIVLPLIIGINYLICLVLWKCNRRR